jgi:hypothetical protein
MFRLWDRLCCTGISFLIYFSMLTDGEINSCSHVFFALVFTKILTILVGDRFSFSQRGGEGSGKDMERMCSSLVGMA